MMDEIKLPPLPQGYSERPWDYEGELFTGGQMKSYTTAAIEADRRSREPVAAQARANVDHTPPYDDCAFRLCDLPGQCRGEGKCHHPARHAYKASGEPIGYIMDVHLEMLKRGQYANLGPKRAGADVAVYLSPQPPQIPEGYKLVPIEPPANCRQRLVREGKPYPRSSCFVCGKFSPNYKECDAMLKAAPEPENQK